MKIKVVLKENREDKFKVDSDLVFYLDSISTNPKESKLENSIVRHNIFDYLSSKENFKLCPNNRASPCHIATENEPLISFTSS